MRTSRSAAWRCNKSVTWAQGAGETAVGGTAALPGRWALQVVKVFKLAVARTGLRDQNAREAGLDPGDRWVGGVRPQELLPRRYHLHLRITGGRQTSQLFGARCWVTSAPRSPSASTSRPPPCSTT
jgi:hypothetical protein